MTITKLQRTVVDALEDIKAQDIRVFNTTGLSDLFDRVVVASATSNRQTRSLANHLKEKAKEKGFPVVSTEGEDSGEWVLVDLGDMIVHIMQPAIRAYYNLEELWGAKPVKLKLAPDGGARDPASPATRAKPPGAVRAPEATKVTPARKPASGSARKGGAKTGTKSGSKAGERSTITTLRRVRTAKA
jgi:ribosome-associated protein